MSKMNRLSALAVSVALSLGLAGCNLWDGDSSTAAPTPEPAPVTHTIGGNISGLASGQQVSLQDNGGDTLILSANGAFIFATPIAANGSYNVVVSEQPASQTCSVSSGSGSNVSANVTSVNVSCSSRNLYVSDAANPQIFQYTIKDDGTLAPLSPAAVTTAGPTQGIAIHPSGKHLYATLNSLSEVQQFDIGNDGSLTPMPTPTVSSGANPYQAVVSPDAKYLFVGNQGAASVTSFSIASDGSLTAIGTYSCSTNCTNTQGLAVDSSTSHLYIGGAAYNDIVTMTIGSDGALSNPVAVNGPGNRAIAVDPTDSYLLAASSTQIDQFAVSPTDGSITPHSVIPLTDSGAETMVFDPSGSHLYLGMNTSNTVNQFYYDNNSGTPTALSPASVSAGSSQTGVYDVAVDTSGSYAYTVNRTSKDISAFVVGSGGVLSANPVSSVVSLPSSPSPDPLSIEIR